MPVAIVTCTLITVNDEPPSRVHLGVGVTMAPSLHGYKAV